VVAEPVGQPMAKAEAAAAALQAAPVLEQVEMIAR
jgi:hypothetical protein